MSKLKDILSKRLSTGIGPIGVPGIPPVPSQKEGRKCVKTTTKTGNVRYVCPASGGQQAVRSLEKLPVKPEDVPQKLLETQQFAPEQLFTPKQRKEHPEKVQEAIARKPKNIHYEDAKEAGADTVHDHLHFIDPEEVKFKLPQTKHYVDPKEAESKTPDTKHFLDPKEAKDKPSKKEDSGTEAPEKKSDDEEEDVEKGLFINKAVYSGDKGEKKLLIIDLGMTLSKPSDLKKVIPAAKRGSKRLVSQSEVQELSSSGKIPETSIVIDLDAAKKYGVYKSFTYSLNKGVGIAIPGIAGVAIEAVAAAGAALGFLGLARNIGLMKRGSPSSRIFDNIRTAEAPPFGTVSQADWTPKAKVKAVPKAAPKVEAKPVLRTKVDVDTKVIPKDRVDTELDTRRMKRPSKKRSRKASRLIPLTLTTGVDGEDKKKDKDKDGRDGRPPLLMISEKQSKKRKLEEAGSGSREGSGGGSKQGTKGSGEDTYQRVGGHKKWRDIKKSRSYVAPFARQVLNKKTSLKEALDKVPWWMQDDLLEYLRHRKKNK